MRTKAIAIVPFLGVVAFYVFPMGSVIYEAWKPQFNNSATVWSTLNSASTWRAVWFSAWQAFLSASLTLIIGLPLAHVAARANGFLRVFVSATTTAAFMLPAPVVVTAFASLFWSSGWLGALDMQDTLVPMFGAHVFLNLAVVVLIVGTTLRSLNTHALEAARTLGATRAQAFLRVHGKVVLSSCASAFSVTFVFCFASFAIVLLLAPAHATTEVLIYRLVASMLDSRGAVTVAMLQVLCLSVALFISSRFAARAKTGTTDVSNTNYRSSSAFAIASSLTFLGVCIYLPLSGLVARSLTPRGVFGFDAYVNLVGTQHLKSSLDALVTSFKYAGLAGPIALATGCLAAYVIHKHNRWGRLLELLLALPLITSGVVLGLGYLVGFGRLPQSLRSAELIIPCVQASVALPLVVRLILPALNHLPKDTVPAARVLGATPRVAFTSVVIPCIMPAVIAAGIISFSVAFGDFGATSVVANSDEPTLPLLIGQLISKQQPGSFATALAGGVMMFVVMIVAVVLARIVENKNRLV